jgi:hypothetical protein
MAMPTLQHNLDIIHGTLERYLVKQPPLTFAYQTYKSFNTFYNERVLQVRGKKLKGVITTGTVGNARASNIWAEDSLVIKNITKEFELDIIKHYEGGMAFNKVEASVNKDAEQIFDVTQTQYKNAMREVIEKIYLATWTGPTSANDVDNMYGIPSWLSMGTDGSAGTYSGYAARYNDASDTGDAAGTAFYKGGLTCSSTVAPEFASYYIDHDGILDETLYNSITRLELEQNFQGPTMVTGDNVPMVNYACYSNRTVILALNALNAKLNSNVGPQPASAGYWPQSGPVLPGGTPIVYVDILNTQRDSIYGKDPLFFVNHSILYPVCLGDWKFQITEKEATNRRLVHEYFIDYVGQTWCDHPKYAGGLISKRPSS